MNGAMHVARQERMLYALLEELGNSLSLHDTLSVLDDGLKNLVRYHAIAVYLARDLSLEAAYVDGENARLLASLEIPYGQGLSGRVAETRQPAIIGDASLEPGLGDGVKLRSALAVPLESGGRLTGVLALYHADSEAFGKDDLRVLLAIRKKAAIAIENARRFEQAERSSAVDPLSSLPNARALFLRLDAELARCRRCPRSLAVSLAVLVCKLEPLADCLAYPIAAGLRSLCREEDCVARTGDEFVLVLSGISPRDLTEKQARIKSMIANLSLAQSGGSRLTVRLTVRMGAAFYPDDGDDAEDLLATAGSRLQIGEPAFTGAHPFTRQLTELGAQLETETDDLL